MPALSAATDVEFGDVQIVAGWVTSNVDFKYFTIFFNVKYLESDIGQRCTYNGRLMGSRVWAIVWCHFNDLEWHQTQTSRAFHYSKLNISETMLTETNNISDACMAYWNVLSTLINIQSHLNYFGLTNICILLFWSLTESPGDLMKHNVADVWWTKLPFGGLSWLPVSFLLHVKYTLSYRIVWPYSVCNVWSQLGLQRRTS